MTDPDHGDSFSIDCTTGFLLSVTGNWELFKFTVKTSRSVWEPIWEVDLPKVTYSEPGVRHTFIVPLSGFSASRMGRPVAGATLNATSIIGIGLNLALVDIDGSPNPHFGDGPFEMILHDVAASFA